MYFQNKALIGTIAEWNATVGFLFNAQRNKAKRGANLFQKCMWVLRKSIITKWLRLANRKCDWSEWHRKVKVLIVRLLAFPFHLNFISGSVSMMPCWVQQLYLYGVGETQLPLCVQGKDHYGTSSKLQVLDDIISILIKYSKP